MAEGFFSFTPFDFNASQGDYFPPHDYEKQETEFRGKEDHPLRIEDFGDFNFLSVESETDFYQQNQSKQTNYQDPNSDYLILDELLSYNDFTITESIPDKNAATDPGNFISNSKPISKPCLESLQLLSYYSTKYMNPKGTTVSERGDETSERDQKLSTEERLRVAGARYVEFFPLGHDEFYMPTHPFGYALSGLSEDETKDVELAHILFSAAEKVGYQQYDRASKLLQRCEWTSSPSGNAVQRLVFYFAKALRRRIERETGRTATMEPERDVFCNSMQGRGMNLHTLQAHQKLPFHQVMHLTAVQAIFEHIKLRSKVHLIDLEIRSGAHWAAFMPSLVDLKELPIKLLRITAVGLKEFGHCVEMSGKRLQAVAESLNIPFSFRAILVSNMMDVKEELFETEDNEMLAIYAPVVLRTMLPLPNCLENLMRVMRYLNPSIMVVSEVEANHNSPSFLHRFVEMLFYFGAFFDCLETCMEKNDESRGNIEAIFGKGVENAIAAEGGERVVRSVKMEVWREFFGRCRMAESELSESCLNQANWLAKGFAFGDFCSVRKNGKCLMFGWKETPLLSISAWEFL